MNLKLCRAAGESQKPYAGHGQNCGDIMRRLSLFVGGALFLLAGFAGVKADVSGAYYDWTVTRQPERPWIHQYDRTMVYKITLGTKLTADKSLVYLRCDQALDVIRRIDNVTCGAPKTVYVVGWQYNGHDSKYPAWGEVNPGIKRPEDATALDSLKWLMAEA